MIIEAPPMAGGPSGLAEPPIVPWVVSAKSAVALGSRRRGWANSSAPVSLDATMWPGRWRAGRGSNIGPSSWR